jgi:CRP/FNR family transcriptional regulator
MPLTGAAYAVHIESHDAAQEFQMLATARLDLPTTAHSRTAPAPQGAQIADGLRMLHDKLPLVRRLLHAGESVYEAGDRFEHLYVVNSGLFKLVNLSADGREQVVGLQFKGDWLGFDGLAASRHGCDAIAMDTGEVWAIRYADLLEACTRHPSLMGLLHSAMGREMTRDRDSLLSICTLPADARVAEFLHKWAESLAERGLRTDQITLRMTRAEIGNYLGMKLETVSRALSRLARDGVIAFTENGRRDIQIPCREMLAAAVQRTMTRDAVLQ